jgi:hypothetical protein
MWGMDTKLQSNSLKYFVSFIVQYVIVTYGKLSYPHVPFCRIKSGFMKHSELMGNCRTLLKSNNLAY